MNIWIIALIVAGLLIAGVFAFAGFSTAQQYEKTSTGCGTCNGKCNVENNCGQSTCSATKTGICNCGK